MSGDCRDSHIKTMASVMQRAVDNDPLVHVATVGLKAHLEQDHGLSDKESPTEAVRVLAGALRYTADRLEEAWTYKVGA